MKKAKKVFVSGCYDPLHSGHIRFFEVASQYGDLYVSIGSDKTIKELKNRDPHAAEEERVYCVEGIKFVRKAFIGSGSGILDFEPELRKIKPDIFIVNKDGDHVSKKKLCEGLGIEYVVLERAPRPGFPKRTSTELRAKSKMPYRIDLAGGWLDQPYVSKHSPGPVLTASIVPTHNFNPRSGLACSTRQKAIRLWGDKEPPEGEEFAKMLFGYENPPGVKEVAGSQDAIGIVFPGLNKLDYHPEEYWPRKITTINDEDILNWLESVLYLVPLEPRQDNFNVLKETRINKTDAENLANASEKCFKAILEKDFDNFAKAVVESYEAQLKMFPLMADENIKKQIEKFKGPAKGWKISGSGGGGYVILVSDKPVEKSINVKIRRNLS